jgi:molybdate transport system permease protein
MPPSLDIAPLWISLKTSLTATAIVLVLGVAAAQWRVRRRSRAWELADGIALLPLVLPPTVVGYILLLVFGRNGVLGRLLLRAGVLIVFSWPATVIAAAVVAFPLMYLTARAAFEQLEPSLLQAARTLGASEWEVLRRVALPLAWPGIAAGAVLAFARALGEFGATLMLAGNLPGRTQTIPIAIFFAIESGNNATALTWVLIVLVISFAVLAAFSLCTRRQRAFLSRSIAGAMAGTTSGATPEAPGSRA